MSEAVQLNVPSLRFPEFSGAWEEKKYGDVFRISAGGDVDKDLLREQRTEEFCFPVYANGDKDFGFQGWTNYFKADAGCITVSGRGNLGTPVARNHKFVPVVRLLVLRPRNKSDIVFFENAIRNTGFYVESTGVPQLTAPQIAGYTIAFPTLPEQQKIAEFLGAVDARAGLLGRRRAALRAYKQGMMQRLFYRELRFTKPDSSPFPDWQERQLGEIASKQASTIVASELAGRTGDYPVYGATGLLTHVDFFEQAAEYIAIVKDGAGVGRVARYGSKSSVLGTLDQIIAKETNSLDYIYQLLCQFDFSRFITGSTIPHIYFRDYGKSKLEVPHPEEQHKIADFLTALDAKIAAVTAQLNATQAFKKGLLQQMFV